VNSWLFASSCVVYINHVHSVNCRDPERLASITRPQILLIITIVISSEQRCPDVAVLCVVHCYRSESGRALTCSTRQSTRLIWHLVLTDSTPTILRGRKSSQKLVLVHRILQLRTSAWLAVFCCSFDYFFFFLRRRLECPRSDRGQGLTASVPPGAELTAGHKPAEKTETKQVKRRATAHGVTKYCTAVRMCPVCSCTHYSMPSSAPT